MLSILCSWPSLKNVQATIIVCMYMQFMHAKSKLKPVLVCIILHWCFLCNLSLISITMAYDIIILSISSSNYPVWFWMKQFECVGSWVAVEVETQHTDRNGSIWRKQHHQDLLKAEVNATVFIFFCGKENPVGLSQFQFYGLNHFYLWKRVEMPGDQVQTMHLTNNPFC